MDKILALFGINKWMLYAAAIVLAILAYVFYSNYTSIMGFFGYETREALLASREIDRSKIKTLEGVIEDNKKEADRKGKSDTITDDATKRINQKGNVLDKDAKAADDKRKRDINSKDPNIKDRAMHTSYVQIKSIWDNYCSFNVDKACAIKIKDLGAL